MDYHSLSRKQLQALCKKHDIPANSTNVQMADALAALLNVVEKPKTAGPCRGLRGQQKLDSADEEDGVESVVTEVSDMPKRNTRSRKQTSEVEQVNEELGQSTDGDVDGGIIDAKSRTRRMKSEKENPSKAKEGDEAMAEMDTAPVHRGGKPTKKAAVEFNTEVVDKSEKTRNDSNNEIADRISTRSKKQTSKVDEIHEELEQPTDGDVDEGIVDAKSRTRRTKSGRENPLKAKEGDKATAEMDMAPVHRGGKTTKKTAVEFNTEVVDKSEKTRNDSNNEIADRISTRSKKQTSKVDEIHEELEQTNGDVDGGVTDAKPRTRRTKMGKENGFKTKEGGETMEEMDVVSLCEGGKPTEQIELNTQEMDKLEKKKRKNDSDNAVAEGTRISTRSKKQINKVDETHEEELEQSTDGDVDGGVTDAKSRTRRTRSGKESTLKTKEGGEAMEEMDIAPIHRGEKPTKKTTVEFQAEGVNKLEKKAKKQISKVDEIPEELGQSTDGDVDGGVTDGKPRTRRTRSGKDNASKMKEGGEATVEIDMGPLHGGGKSTKRTTVEFKTAEMDKLEKKKNELNNEVAVSKKEISKVDEIHEEELDQSTDGGVPDAKPRTRTTRLGKKSALKTKEGGEAMEEMDIALLHRGGKPTKKAIVEFNVEEVDNLEKKKKKEDLDNQAAEETRISTRSKKQIGKVNEIHEDLGQSTDGDVDGGLSNAKPRTRRAKLIKENASKREEGDEVTEENAHLHKDGKPPQKTTAEQNTVKVDKLEKMKNDSDAVAEEMSETLVQVEQNMNSEAEKNEGAVKPKLNVRQLRKKTEPAVTPGSRRTRTGASKMTAAMTNGHAVSGRLSAQNTDREETVKRTPVTSSRPTSNNKIRRPKGTAKSPIVIDLLDDDDEENSSVIDAVAIPSKKTCTAKCKKEAEKALLAQMTPRGQHMNVRAEAAVKPSESLKRAVTRRGRNGGQRTESIPNTSAEEGKADNGEQKALNEFDEKLEKMNAPVEAAAKRSESLKSVTTRKAQNGGPKIKSVPNAYAKEYKAIQAEEEAINACDEKQELLSSEADVLDVKEKIVSGFTEKTNSCKPEPRRNHRKPNSAESEGQTKNPHQIGVATRQKTAPQDLDPSDRQAVDLEVKIPSLAVEGAREEVLAQSSVIQSKESQSETEMNAAEIPICKRSKPSTRNTKKEQQPQFPINNSCQVEIRGSRRKQEPVENEDQAKTDDDMHGKEHGSGIHHEARPDKNEDQVKTDHDMHRKQHESGTHQETRPGAEYFDGKAMDAEVKAQGFINEDVAERATEDEESQINEENLDQSEEVNAAEVAICQSSKIEQIQPRENCSLGARNEEVCKLDEKKQQLSNQRTHPGQANACDSEFGDRCSMGKGKEQMSDQMTPTGEGTPYQSDCGDAICLNKSSGAEIVHTENILMCMPVDAAATEKQQNTSATDMSLMGLQVENFFNSLPSVAKLDKEENKDSEISLLVESDSHEHIEGNWGLEKINSVDRFEVLNTDFAVTVPVEIPELVAHALLATAEQFGEPTESCLVEEELQPSRADSQTNGLLLKEEAEEVKLSDSDPQGAVECGVEEKILVSNAGLQINYLLAANEEDGEDKSHIDSQTDGLLLKDGAGEIKLSDSDGQAAGERSVGEKIPVSSAGLHINFLHAANAEDHEEKSRDSDSSKEDGGPRESCSVEEELRPSHIDSQTDSLLMKDEEVKLSNSDAHTARDCGVGEKIPVSNAGLQINYLHAANEEDHEDNSGDSDNSDEDLGLRESCSVEEELQPSNADSQTGDLPLKEGAEEVQLSDTDAQSAGDCGVGEKIRVSNAGLELKDLHAANEEDHEDKSGDSDNSNEDGGLRESCSVEEELQPLNADSQTDDLTLKEGAEEVKLSDTDAQAAGDCGVGEKIPVSNAGLELNDLRAANEEDHEDRSSDSDSSEEDVGLRESCSVEEDLQPSHANSQTDGLLPNEGADSDAQAAGECSVGGKIPVSNADLQINYLHAANEEDHEDKSGDSDSSAGGMEDRLSDSDSSGKSSDFNILSELPQDLQENNGSHTFSTANQLEGKGELEQVSWNEGPEAEDCHAELPNDEAYESQTSDSERIKGEVQESAILDGSGENNGPRLVSGPEAEDCHAEEGILVLNPELPNDEAHESQTSDPERIEGEVQESAILDGSGGNNGPRLVSGPEAEDCHAEDEILVVNAELPNDEACESQTSDSERIKGEVHESAILDGSGENNGPKLVSGPEAEDCSTEEMILVSNVELPNAGVHESQTSYSESIEGEVQESTILDGSGQNNVSQLVFDAISLAEQLEPESYIGAPENEVCSVKEEVQFSCAYLQHDSLPVKDDFENEAHGLDSDDGLDSFNTDILCDKMSQNKEGQIENPDTEAEVFQMNLQSDESQILSDQISMKEEDQLGQEEDLQHDNSLVSDEAPENQMHRSDSFNIDILPHKISQIEEGQVENVYVNENVGAERIFQKNPHSEEKDGSHVLSDSFFLKEGQSLQMAENKCDAEEKTRVSSADWQNDYSLVEDDAPENEIRETDGTENFDSFQDKNQIEQDCQNETADDEEIAFQKDLSTIENHGFHRFSDAVSLSEDRLEQVFCNGHIVAECGVEDDIQTSNADIQNVKYDTLEDEGKSDAGGREELDCFNIRSDAIPQKDDEYQIEQACQNEAKNEEKGRIEQTEGMLDEERPQDSNRCSEDYLSEMGLAKFMDIKKLLDCKVDMYSILSTKSNKAAQKDNSYSPSIRGMQLAAVLGKEESQDSRDKDFASTANSLCQTVIEGEELSFPIQHPDERRKLLDCNFDEKISSIKSDNHLPPLEEGLLRSGNQVCVSGAGQMISLVNNKCHGGQFGATGEFMSPISAAPCSGLDNSRLEQNAEVLTTDLDGERKFSQLEISLKKIELTESSEKEMSQLDTPSLKKPEHAKSNNMFGAVCDDGATSEEGMLSIEALPCSGTDKIQLEQRQEVINSQLDTPSKKPMESNDMFSGLSTLFEEECNDGTTSEQCMFSSEVAPCSNLSAEKELSQLGTPSLKKLARNDGDISVALFNLFDKVCNDRATSEQPMLSIEGLPCSDTDKIQLEQRQEVNHEHSQLDTPLKKSELMESNDMFSGFSTLFEEECKDGTTSEQCMLSSESNLSAEKELSQLGTPLLKKPELARNDSDMSVGLFGLFDEVCNDGTTSEQSMLSVEVLPCSDTDEIQLEQTQEVIHEHSQLDTPLKKPELMESNDMFSGFSTLFEEKCNNGTTSEQCMLSSEVAPYSNLSDEKELSQLFTPSLKQLGTPSLKQPEIARNYSDMSLGLFELFDKVCNDGATSEQCMLSIEDLPCSDMAEIQLEQGQEVIYEHSQLDTPLKKPELLESNDMFVGFSTLFEEECNDGTTSEQCMLSSEVTPYSNLSTEKELSQLGTPSMKKPELGRNDSDMSLGLFELFDKACNDGATSKQCLLSIEDLPCSDTAEIQLEQGQEVIHEHSQLDTPLKKPELMDSNAVFSGCSALLEECNDVTTGEQCTLSSEVAPCSNSSTEKELCQLGTPLKKPELAKNGNDISLGLFELFDEACNNGLAGEQPMLPRDIGSDHKLSQLDAPLEKPEAVGLSSLFEEACDYGKTGVQGSPSIQGVLGSVIDNSMLEQTADALPTDLHCEQKLYQLSTPSSKKLEITESNGISGEAHNHGALCSAMDSILPGQTQTLLPTDLGCDQMDTPLKTPKLPKYGSMSPCWSGLLADARNDASISERLQAEKSYATPTPGRKPLNPKVIIASARKHRNSVFENRYGTAESDETVNSSMKENNTPELTKLSVRRLGGLLLKEKESQTKDTKKVVGKRSALKNLSSNLLDQRLESVGCIQPFTEDSAKP